MSARETSGSRLSFHCCGVRIDALGPEEARTALAGSVYGQPRAVHLCNAYSLSLARTDLRYRESLNNSDLNLADGQPVAFMARRLGHRNVHSSVRGPALMQDLLERGQETGLRHYFYGSTATVCHQLQLEATRRFPRAQIVGIEAPPFRELTYKEKAAFTRRIRDARPDIVWVGLGTPKQDSFVEEFRDQLGTTLVAIGAGFDFLAGTKGSAPAWMQRVGLEWFFRLASEPRRLWRRYLFGNVIFVLGAFGDLAAARRKSRN